MAYCSVDTIKIGRGREFRYVSSKPITATNRHTDPMTPLWKQDAVSLLTAFRDGSKSPCEALSNTLDRINRFQTQINAYSHQNDRVMEDALASEKRWASGQPMGALDGVPLIIKDNMAVQGMPASWGNSELATRQILKDELPVERLRQAGALIVGKGNTPEFAVEGYTANAKFGVTANPFNTQLTPGGSSGAIAAAVASGQATLGIGTDGGGSIRRPAAYCGLIGLKPGLGHYPRANGLPQVLLDFEVVGPLTRTVRDARLMDSVLRGESRLDPVSRRHIPYDVQSPLRVLYVQHLNQEPCDPLLLTSARHFVDQLANAGCHVSDGELPLNLKDMTANWKTIAEIGMARLFDADELLALSASSQYQAMAERGRSATLTQLWHIMNTVKTLRIQASQLFADWDVIVTPATAAMPWDAAHAFPPVINGSEVGPRGHAIYSGWVNATGLPSIALPSKSSPEGIPIGVQLVGDMGSESMLLDLAEQHQTEHGGFAWPAQFS